MPLIQFDSLGDFARLASKYPQAFSDEINFAGCTFKDAIKFGIAGDTTYVERATQMLDELDCQIPETLAFTRKRSPFGGRVNYGDWIAGAPDPMRRRIRVASEYAPLKIIVGVSCSAGISSELMERRGIAILALVFRLQKIRPVDLFLLTEDQAHHDIRQPQTNWHYNLIRIESTPFALGQACFGLCSDSIERHLSYTVLPSFGAHASWPVGYNTPEYWQLKRERLNAAPHDLLIRAAYLTDPLINQPLDWIKEQLNRYAATSDE